MKIIKCYFNGRSYYRIIGLFLFVVLIAVNAGAASIEAINVVGDGDAVMIETTEDVKYTVFKLSDPPRLIVDIPGIETSKVKDKITVNNAFVGVISASDFKVAGKPMGRIVIGLKDGVDHEVKSGERSILVKLSGGVSTESAGDGPVANKATSILDIKIEQKGDKTLISIVTNGEVGNFNSFGFDDQASVVIDVWGVDSSLKKELFDIESPHVKSIKIGEHEEKVRLVFSSMTDKVPNYFVEKSGEVILLTLGVVKTEKVVNIPEAPTNLLIVEDVDFEKFKDRARLTVQSSGKPRYSLKRSLDGKLLTIDILDATLPPSLIRTIDAMGLETPVATISSYQSSKEPTSEVRILLRLKKDVPFNIYENDNIITVDFSLSANVLLEEPDEDVRLAMAKAASERKTRTASQRRASFAKTEAELKARADAERAAFLRAESEKKAATAKADSEMTGAERAAMELAETRKKETLDRVKVSAAKKALAAKAEAEVKAKSEAKRRKVTIDKAEALMKAYTDREFKVVKERTTEPQRTANLDDVKSNDSIDAYGKKVYTGRRLDLDMVAVDIKDILKLIAEVSDLNIIAGDDVRGTVTMRLKNVPWDQALDLILLTKGLGQDKVNNVVRIAPLQQIRKEREEAIAARNARKKVEELDTAYIQVNYEEATNLERHIKEVLSDRGSVTSHEATNTIIVRDITESITAAKDVVVRLDRVVPQVLIEARIVEAETSFARDLGIQWGLDYSNKNTHSDVFGSSTGASGQNPPLSTREGAANYAVNLPATGVAGALGAMGFVFGTSGDNPMILDLRLTAGEQAGLLKTISRPRITTLDNKEAKIEQGESIPFETASDSGTATTFIDANLSLTVKPQITPDGSVLMEIKASRNSIGTFKTSSGEPSINKKEAQTEVLVRDGETTVIGGIVISDTTSSEGGIPYLKNIPLLGWLFKNRSVSDKQTELLIFITPTIIRNDAEMG